MAPILPVHSRLQFHLNELTSVFPDLQNVILARHETFQEKYQALENLITEWHAIGNEHWGTYQELLEMGGEHGMSAVDDAYDAYKETEQRIRHYRKAADLLLRVTNQEKLRHYISYKEKKRRIPHDVYRSIGNFL